MKDKSTGIAAEAGCVELELQGENGTICKYHQSIFTSKKHFPHLFVEWAPSEKLLSQGHPSRQLTGAAEVRIASGREERR